MVQINGIKIEELMSYEDEISGQSFKTDENFILIADIIYLIYLPAYAKYL